HAGSAGEHSKGYRRSIHGGGIVAGKVQPAVELFTRGWPRGWQYLHLGAQPSTFEPERCHQFVQPLLKPGRILTAWTCHARTHPQQRWPDMVVRRIDALIEGGVRLRSVVRGRMVE